MNLMTPEEARLTIRDTEEMRPDLLKSWRALETIAGMRAEYMALNRADENGEWHQVTPWSTEWPFHTGHVPDPRFDKVIRRYVTEPEEA